MDGFKLVNRLYAASGNSQKTARTNGVNGFVRIYAVEKLQKIYIEHFGTHSDVPSL
jgi:hypothetical protein